MRVFMLGLLLLVTTSAHAHVALIGKCKELPLPGAAKRIHEVVNSNGTVSEAYDRDGDGRVDIEAVSHVLSAKINPASHEVEVHHHPWPFMYILDTDRDGEPDTSYVDRAGDGSCSKFEVYKEDLNNAGKAQKDNDSAPDGKL